MGGRYVLIDGRAVFVPDAEPRAERVELFEGVRDVSSVPQVADVLGVCPQTVRRLIARGELKSIHVGHAVRVTKEAIIEFVARQEGE